MTSVVIAIDGPAGAGKGTIAKYLATYYGLKHLDTGLLYRLLGYKANQQNVPLNHIDALMTIAETLDFKDLNNPILRHEHIGNLASQIAILPQVREFLTKIMQGFCQNIFEPYQGVVLDGRDIGTVVCPNADLKIFITADSQTRLQRRNLELKFRAIEAEINLSEIHERDERDENRATAPLVMASEAHLIDTTNLSIEQACKQACKLVEDILKLKPQIQNKHA